MSQLWWISWNQMALPEHGMDSRPSKWPPPEPVLAFWESGFGLGYTVCVALVRAPTDLKAQRAIERGWKPGIGQWRFCNQYPTNGPPGDRFPVPEWSLELGRWPWKEMRNGG